MYMSREAEMQALRECNQDLEDKLDAQQAEFEGKLDAQQAEFEGKLDARDAEIAKLKAELAEATGGAR